MNKINHYCFWLITLAVVPGPCYALDSQSSERFTPAVQCILNEYYQEYVANPQFIGNMRREFDSARGLSLDSLQALFVVGYISRKSSIAEGLDYVNLTVFELMGLHPTRNVIVATNCHTKEAMIFMCDSVSSAWKELAEEVNRGETTNPATQALQVFDTSLDLDLALESTNKLLLWEERDSYSNDELIEIVHLLFECRSIQGAFPPLFVVNSEHKVEIELDRALYCLPLDADTALNNRIYQLSQTSRETIQRVLNDRQLESLSSQVLHDSNVVVVRVNIHCYLSGYIVQADFQFDGKQLRLNSSKTIAQSVGDMISK